MKNLNLVHVQCITYKNILHVTTSTLILQCTVYYYTHPISAHFVQMEFFLSLFLSLWMTSDPSDFVPVVDIPPTLQRPPLNGPHHSHHHFIPGRLRNSPCIFPICCDVGKDPYSIVTDFYSIHFRFH